MITGILLFVLVIIGMVLLFVFGILGTILGLVFRVTSFGLRVIIKPVLSLVLILLLLSLIF